MKIEVKLSQAQRRHAAMLQSGLVPREIAFGRGTQVQRDRKASAKGGYAKHKGRAFD